MNSTVLVCEAPAVPAGTTTISYTLRLDNAPSPNATSSSALALEVVPDPVVTDFNPKIIPRSTLRKNLYCLKFLSYFHNLYSKHSSYLNKGYILSTCSLFKLIFIFEYYILGKKLIISGDIRN